MDAPLTVLKTAGLASGWGSVADRPRLIVSLEIPCSSAAGQPSSAELAVILAVSNTAGDSKSQGSGFDSLREHQYVVPVSAHRLYVVVGLPQCVTFAAFDSFV